MVKPHAPDGVSITALGGLGEIGMNCLVFEQHGPSGAAERLVVDCGATFPHDDYGIELHHPRFDHLAGEPGALAGLVLTHGHEDHVGAVPYLARALGAVGAKLPPIYGPPYALALCRLRLEEHSVEAELVEIAPRRRFEVGSFEIEPIHVTHSIPQATALSIETRAGRIVHSGDFKLDPSPRDGLLTDEARLEELGDEGVRLLLSDSTNALRAGHTGSEQTVSDALERIVGAAKGRVLVALFASNCHRLDAVAAAARASGRKLCLLGRSMHNHANVGRATGVLDWSSDLVVASEVAARMPRESVVYAASGTQGEWRGALRRVASGSFPDVRLERGDEVIMSSRVIPGNERQVFAMLNDLAAQGVVLHTRELEVEVHVSGHAQRDEQRRLLELLRPRYFVPLHGTRLHLERHASLARETGVEATLVLENGQRARLDGEGLRRDGAVPAGSVATDGRFELTDEILRERRKLGRAGLVVVVIDPQRAEPVVGVTLRGLPDAESLRPTVARAARHALLASEPELRGLDAIERVRRVVRWRLREALGRRPVVEVIALT
jgi:ribonuclease J